VYPATASATSTTGAPVKRHDAGAHRLQPRRAFQHGGPQAAKVQGEGGGQPADARADHDRRAFRHGPTPLLQV
jgi:hypothetical protein